MTTLTTYALILGVMSAQRLDGSRGLGFHFDHHTWSSQVTMLLEKQGLFSVACQRVDVTGL